MATTYIPINTAQRLGNQLRQAISQFLAARQSLIALKAIIGYSS